MLFLKQKKLILTLSLGLVLLLPQASLARGIVPCGGYKVDGTREPACTVTDIFVLIAKATNWLIGAAGIYAVFMIITSGFYMIISMGNEERISKQKEALSNAVIGFVVVMLAFVLINTTVNFLLASKCNVNLADPLSYLSTCNSTPQH